MRELQPDDFNVESLRCLGIRDREMRLVQVHVTSLHALYRHRFDYSFGLAVVFLLLAMAALVLRLAGWLRN
jgi:hypothetical protein